MNKVINTPWGPAQTVYEIAPGITLVDCANHGGIMLSPERLSELPEAFQVPMWAGLGNYEEHHDWAIVQYFWAEVFADYNRREMEYYQAGNNPFHLSEQQIRWRIEYHEARLDASVLRQNAKKVILNERTLAKFVPHLPEL